MWQFGKLKLERFTQNKFFYTIQDLERLFAAVNYVFKQCELQLEEKEEVRNDTDFDRDTRINYRA